MAKKEVLRVEHVGMKFNLSQEKVDDLKDYIIKLIKGQLKYNEFWALKDINFTLRKGDRLGILGLNGAGKSTLLKVIAGVLNPVKAAWLQKVRLLHYWNWELDLTSSIPDGKIYICMVQFSAFQRNF